MIQTSKEIKTLMLSKDPADLAHIISKHDSDILVINNGDRTIRVETKDDISNYTKVFNKAIAMWIGFVPNISMTLVYNIFPLSKNTCIIKI